MGSAFGTGRLMREARLQPRTGLRPTKIHEAYARDEEEGGIADRFTLWIG